MARSDAHEAWRDHRHDGGVVHSLRIEGVVAELYDVVVLPGVRRPTALGFKSDEIRRVISVGPALQG